ncbi:MAG: class I SAM-dependent methyltransferase [Gammaproteobacteria bacterium]
MKAIYDGIGEEYSIGRRTDPTIALFLDRFLSDSNSILNVGAGTGSYEPSNKNLVAVEPSTKMISQRADQAYPVKQAFAENLPFDDASFTHSMTILSMHHWLDRAAAFREIKRVTAKRFVALTWNPDSKPYWLTRDYFPEIYEIDRSIFPSTSELSDTFPGMKYYPLEIPADCIDGFTAAYWARPVAYLDSVVRSGMSTFFKINNLEQGLTALRNDLKSGAWHSRNGYLLELKRLDVGYVVAVWDA